MEILIVEDDERMAALLKRGLEAEGHVGIVSADGLEALDFATSRSFDVLLLDLMIPGIDGFELVRRLRSDGNKTPVLMLTARDTPDDVVRGLDLGADDYVTKPFAFDELLARVRAVSRRGPIEREAVLRIGDLALDPASRRVIRGERIVSLTRREFQILELLMRREGRVVTRGALIEGIWGHGSDVESNTVDVFISGLRRKVDTPDDGLCLIRTVRGIGFSIACLNLDP